MSHFYNLSRKLPFVLSFLALILGIATYWSLTHNENLIEKTRVVLPFIYLDLTVLLLLAVVIAKRLVELWLERKRGLKGAKLHVHMVALFSLIAVIPAICIAIFSALFFNIGVDAWFGQPVKQALEEAGEVAQAYLKEHQKAIRFDAQVLVNRLRPQMLAYIQDPKSLSTLLSEEAEERGLGEIVIFNSNRQVIARSYLTFALEFEKILLTDFERAKYDEIIVREEGDRVRALIKLDPLSGTYLFIGKLVDATVIQHLNRTQSAIENYHQLAAQHSGLHLTFIAFFLLITLLLLLAAVWVGLTLSNIFIKPISRLIEAAEDVSQGNLSIKITEDPLNNELDDLAKSFNRMTHRLQQQNHDLIISQRKSAWADVARKIAHEIKNPLTPIQLSAERLKRRYLKEITTDSQTFQNCIDTIIRQVQHIGSLVNEFSSFARMPEPQLKENDLGIIVQQAIFLQRQAHPHIEFIIKNNYSHLIWFCDEQQISQVLTNLLQNSINAISESTLQTNKGLIFIHLKIDNKKLIIEIDDNGPGFPKNFRERLIEPYYTTRSMGTGLGLAIVFRIISDHNGHIYLEDSIYGGAKVRLVFDYSPIKHLSVE